MITRVYVDKDLNFITSFVKTDLLGKPFNHSKFMNIQKLMLETDPYCPEDLDHCLDFPFDDTDVKATATLNWGTGKNHIIEPYVFHDTVFFKIKSFCPAIFDALYDYFKEHQDDNSALTFNYYFNNYKEYLISSLVEYLHNIERNYTEIKLSSVMEQEYFNRIYKDFESLAKILL